MAQTSPPCHFKIPFPQMGTTFFAPPPLVEGYRLQTVGRSFLPNAKPCPDSGQPPFFPFATSSPTHPTRIHGPGCTCRNVLAGFPPFPRIRPVMECITSLSPFCNSMSDIHRNPGTLFSTEVHFLFNPWGSLPFLCKAIAPIFFFSPLFLDSTCKWHGPV